MVYKLGICIALITIWTAIIYNLGKQSANIKTLVVSQKVTEASNKINEAVESHVVAKKTAEHIIYRDKIIIRYRAIESKYGVCIIESNDVDDINEYLK